MLRNPALLALALLGACATTPTLVPEQPTDKPYLARVANAGVTLEVVANAWRGYPAALADQFTPLWVHVVNQSEQAYDITFNTLQLVDEQGRLYAAVPPMEVVRMMVGAQPEPAPPALVASLDSDAPPIELAQFGIGIGSYDPGYGSPLGYSPYAYPPPENAASSILGPALREGRLLPRTQASGFVYFQRAYAGSVLTLRLEAPSELPGAAPLLVETRFAVKK
jgi:hypothetical protein